MDSPGYCVNCGTLVYAVRPDPDVADWFAAPAGLLDTTFLVETTGQCVCGLTSFSVSKVGKVYEGRCSGQTIEGEFHPGCGREILVRMKKACDVVWPA